MKPRPSTAGLLGNAKVVFFAAAISTLSDGCVFFYFWMRGQILWAIALHLAIVCIAGIASYKTYKSNSNSLLVVLTPMILLMGPLGSGVCLIAAAVGLLYGENSSSPKTWLEFFDYGKEEYTEHVHDRIAFGLDDFSTASGVEPFRDILAGGTVYQKQLVLAKICRFFRPNLAPLLLQAAQDLNAAVRVQAATALARIEREFMQRCMKLEKELAEVPVHDQAWLKLAQLYDDYAYAGLADSDERARMRSRAIEIYELHYNHGAEIRLVLARLYLRDGQLDKARALLSEMLLEEPVPIAINWYMEILFRLKDFKELRRMARKYSINIRDAESFQSLPDITNAAAFWDTKSRRPGKWSAAHAK